MNRTLLTLDCGNTSLNGVFWRAGQMWSCFRLRHGEAPGEALRTAAAEVATLVGVMVPGRQPDLDWLAAPSCRWVGRDLPPPGRVLYAEPAEMGLDRRVACHGALRRLGPGLVVDCGTAVTCTHVDAEGCLRGLAIAPGLACMRRGLAAAAPALAPFLGAAQPPPRTGVPSGTGENLALGLAAAWAGALQELVREAELRLASIEVDVGHLVFTGSDGWLAWRTLGRGRHEPGLLHHGLHALCG